MFLYVKDWVYILLTTITEQDFNVLVKHVQVSLVVFVHPLSAEKPSGDFAWALNIYLFYNFKSGYLR